MVPDTQAFDYQPRTRIVFGPGSIAQLGKLLAEFGGRRVLVVTDEGLVKAGHADRAMKSISAAGLEAVLFDRVKENPSTREVDECLAAARQGRIDAIVGLGGGSSMDTAKGCNFLFTNGGRMQDYWGVEKAAKPMLPMIAVPTTAGTGSECQSFALIADEQTHQKMACGDSKAAAKVAILDPELTISQPRRVTACTGIDALAHAVETAVTRRRNGLSLIFSHRAFASAVEAFPIVLQEPASQAARAQMLWAAALAGMAIENSMLGAAHAAANPLTARFGIVHGEAVGLMLPFVIRYNGQDAAARSAYADLAAAAGLVRRADPESRAVEALAERIEHLLNLAGMPNSIEAAGARRDALPQLAQEAAKQWTATFNPRSIGAADFEKLYAGACEPRGTGDQGRPLASVRSRAEDGGRG